MPKASPATASTSPASAPPTSGTSTEPKAEKGSMPGKYERILLKLSGESFSKPGTFGIDPEELEFIGGEVKGAATAGAQLAVVVGGGNIIRGAELASQG